MRVENLLFVPSKVKLEHKRGVGGPKKMATGNNIISKLVATQSADSYSHLYSANTYKKNPQNILFTVPNPWKV